MDFEKLFETVQGYLWSFGQMPSLLIILAVIIFVSLRKDIKRQKKWCENKEREIQRKTCPHRRAEKQIIIERIKYVIF